MEPSDTADVVIAGAGIAGVSTAYHLAAGRGIGDIVLCDPRPPLTLTSDKSTECYRNWWPGPRTDMVDLMNRSIDLLQQWAAESGNRFHLSQRGYLYVTGDPAGLRRIEDDAREIASLGAGELRVHRGETADPGYRSSPTEGFDPTLTGADLFVGPDVLHRRFPYLAEAAVGALHARRAGWFSAQQLGAFLLEGAKDAGVRFMQRPVTGVDVKSGRVRGVFLDDGSRLATEVLVNAAGPLVREVAAMHGEDLPVFSEVHRKIAFRDHRRAVPREVPMLIWSDPQTILWSEEERTALRGDPSTARLTGELGPGAHCRPEGGRAADTVLGLWEYHAEVREPSWPLPPAPLYPEMVLRGLSTMIPAIAAYLERLPAPFVDGGYYTKTRENRPLVGPMDTRGAYVVGALSGFGVMAAAAAGELVSLHVAGSPLPGYAGAFRPDRYENPSYRELLERMTDGGQI
jgi:glycine/D-amino acid oxidase-like deaminating enzyme